jgi:hypothetical protein
MKLSRQFLLGMLALGLQAGLVGAAEPSPEPAKDKPASATAAPSGSVVMAPQVPCTACCTSDCCAIGHGQILAGVGLYWVQPYVANNPAFGIEITTGRGPDGAPPGTRVDQVVDIRQHMDLAPLTWLGYLTDGGWGGRARYWYLREGSDQTAAPSAAPGTTVAIESASPLGLSLFKSQIMNVTSELAMQFLDLEAIDYVRAGRWELLLSGGIRLMRVDETYNAYNFFSLLSKRNFQAVGPTFGLEAHRPFGASGLALYLSTRGSVVIGSANEVATIPNLHVTTQDHQDRGVPIAELEVGLEYDRPVGHARLFGQIAFVGQDWFGVGNASRSTIHMISGGDFPGGGYNVDGDIDLLGVCFRLGVSY